MNTAKLQWRAAALTLVLAGASAAIVTDAERADFDAQWVRTTKFYDVVEKKGEQGGMFGIHVDPTKCKGCGECVVACGSHAALEMIEKSEEDAATG